MITNIQPVVPQTAPPVAMKTDAAEFTPLTQTALSQLSAEPFVPQQVISSEKKVEPEGSRNPAKVNRNQQQQVIAAEIKVEPEGSKLSKLLKTISDEVVEITKVSNQIIKNKVVNQALLKKFLDLIQLAKDPSTIFSCRQSLLARELGQQKPISELDSKFSKGGGYNKK